MPISWEIAFVPRVLKIQRFWLKRKGLILADFQNMSLAGLNNKKYLSVLTAKWSYLTQNLLKVLLKQKLAKTNAY